MLRTENNIKEKFLKDIENEIRKSADPTKATEKNENGRKVRELRDITYVNLSLFCEH